MSAGETVYVDIAAVRIQRYLSRTPSLRGRRAASAALAEATSWERIEKSVAGRAERNTEAGKADGVVNLQLTAHDPARREALVDEVSTAVLRRLRRELPGAEFQAVWGVGDGYLRACVAQIKPRIERGEVRSDLPPGAEFPLAAPCRMCRTDPAVKLERVTGKEHEQALCLDCVMRNQSRYEQTKKSDNVEFRLAESTGVARGPEDFEGLAGMGTPGRGRNQLATVFIDGNAVGAFFAALAKAAAGDETLQQEKRRISRKLSDATFEALEVATIATMAEPLEDCLWVVPHVLGGDDVLVSMPAERGWAFTVAFLDYFEQKLREHTGETITVVNARRGPAERPIAAPSASAGLVFADASYPLNLLVDAAEGCLRAAKRLVAGRASSVQWLDITADGTQGPGEPGLPLDQLRGAAAELTALARIPASHRATLAAAVRESRLVTAAAVAARVGHLASVRPFLPKAGAATGTGAAETPAGISLGQALRIARWWAADGADEEGARDVPTRV